MAECNGPCDVLRAAGGGTRSAWWMQLKADLSATPVEVIAQPEPGTFGAALLAGGQPVFIRPPGRQPRKWSASRGATSRTRSGAPSTPTAWRLIPRR